MYARTVFRQLDELVLFLFDRRVPPEEWAGGECALADCKGEREYQRFELGRGAELKVGSDWLTVGRRPLRVMNLIFQDGQESMGIRGAI